MHKDPTLNEAHFRLAHAGMAYRDCIVWLSSPSPLFDGAAPYVMARTDRGRVQRAALDVVRRLQHNFQPETPDVDDECWVCRLTWAEGLHTEVAPNIDA